jgi:hypothetical protein
MNRTPRLVNSWIELTQWTRLLPKRSSFHTTTTSKARRRASARSVEPRTRHLRAAHLVLVHAGQLPPAALDILGQLADLEGVGLVLGGYSAVDSGSHESSEHQEDRQTCTGRGDLCFGFLSRASRTLRPEGTVASPARLADP